MLLELTQLRIQPGQQILLDRVSWQQFESILTELGERRAARVSYGSSQAIKELRNWIKENV